MSYGGGGPRGPPGGGRGPPGGGRGPPGRGPPGRGGRGAGETILLEQAIQAMQAALRGLALADPNAPKWDINVYKQLGPRRPMRPNLGSSGRPLTISANHFPMRLSATEAYHYDVDFRSLALEGVPPPRRPPPPRPAGRPPPPFPIGLARKVLQKLATEQGWPDGWATDGRKNLYATTPFLPVERTHEFPVRMLADTSGKERTIVVTIKYAASIDLTSLQKFIRGEAGAEGAPIALMVLDTVLRHGVSRKENAFMVANSVYFHMPGDPNMFLELGRGLEAWAGYKQAVRPCQYGLSLNIDLAATAFVAGNKKLPDLVALMLGKRDASQLRPPLTPRDLRVIRDSLRGLRVIVDRGEGRVFRKTIRGVSPKDCNQTKFFLEEEKREISVTEYNKKVYNLDLKFPWLPPVNVSPDRARPVYQPMEVCTSIVGQRKLVLDDARVTSNMLKFAGLKPFERRPYLESVITQPALGGFNQDPTVKAFGIEVSDKMKDVPARVLQQPMLAYGGGMGFNPGLKGAWNLEGKKFNDPKNITSWAFLNFCRQADVDIPGQTGMQAFIKDLIYMIGAVGMGEAPLPPVLHATGGKSVLELMKDAAKAAETTFGGQKAQLIICMVPVAKAPDPYKEIKVASDSHLGIPSQCFAAPKASVGREAQYRDRAQYTANLCLKINAKLGGVNVKLAGEARVVPVIGGKPFIVMGADVTHPVGFSETEPSIAAVVGSYDATMGRFSSRVMQQAHRQEIIADLKGATKDLLRIFHQRTKGRKPEAILFYRDGVSEGQFQEVLNHEYNALRQACMELEATYCPPITFVVVQKRHGTRLFPDERNQEKFNVLPGTTVDREICHPIQFDYYLNSHAGLQGHNKTAHYHVLVDENGFSADGLQLLTYWMTYLYARCSRSVSLPPPAYYAHLAAFRGRLMISERDESASEISGVSAAPSYHSINPQLVGTMFWV